MIEEITDGRDCVIAGETIKRLIFEGKIPVLSAIVIKDQARKTQWAELDKVSQIEIRPVPKHAALEGFLVGAIIDTALIIALKGAFSSWSFAVM